MNSMKEESKLDITKLEISNIQLFDGSNFSLWKRSTLIKLRKRGHLTWTVKSPDASKQEEVEADEDAFDFILERLHKKIAINLDGTTTTKAAWERLLSLYENSNSVSQDRLLAQFNEYKKDKKSKMSEHIRIVEHLANQLNAVKVLIPEPFIMNKLLHTLPPKYNSLVHAWDSVPTKERTRESLIQRLLKAELMERDDVDDTNGTALVSQKKQNRKPKMRCNFCRYTNHLEKDCFKKKAQEQKDGKQNAPQDDNSNEINAFCGTILNRLDTKDLLYVKHRNDESWILDSGASSHVTNRRDWLEDIVIVNESLQIGNSQSVTAREKGSIRLSCKTQTGNLFIKLKDVLYIKEMPKNVVSTGKLLMSGATVNSNQKGCIIRRQDKRVIAVGHLNPSTSLTTLECKVFKPNISVMLTKSTRTVDDWHQSLGHADTNMIEKMLKSGSATDMSATLGENEKCTVCPAGKGTRASHTGTSSFVAEEAGSIVDLDLIKSTTPSLGGHHYIMLFTDRFSGFRNPYFLENKSETPKFFQKYISEFEKASGKKVKTIVTDNGSEFNSKEIDNLLSFEHVSLELSAPYTPQQNGNAERSNRTLIETARTLLAGTSLGTELWAEAASTAAYMRNRVGCPKTPYELLTGRKPTVSHIVPFGTQVQALIIDKRLPKFDRKTENGFIVGFTNRSNTYRVYLPERNDVRVTCDLIFRKHLQTRRSQNHDPDIDATKLVAAENTTAERSIDKYFRELEKRRFRLSSFSESSDTNESSIIGPGYSPLSRHSGQNSDASSDHGGYETSRETLGDDSLANYNLQLCRYGACISYAAFVAAIKPNLKSEIPKSFKQAMDSPERTSWLEGIKTELQAHQKNGTFEVVNFPSDETKLFSMKWVFVPKEDELGNIVRYKSRLVMRGYEQKYGVHFFETFAPVAKIESIRTPFAVAAHLGLEFKQFDVATAFLNGKIDEEIFCQPPEGMKIVEGKCLKLKKALYGLKQAPRAWYSMFNQEIIKMGFKATLSDPCVYTNVDKQSFICVYVDDGLIFAKDIKTCQEILDKFVRIFDVKEITSQMFLGMKVNKTNATISLNQSKYVSDFVRAFEIEDTRKTIKTPMADAKILTKEDANDKDIPASTPYREAIGSLLYAASHTRPDISFTVGLLSRYCEKPKQKHWGAVKRCLTYLKQTKNSNICYHKTRRTLEIKVFSDADFAMDSDDQRRSNSGVLVLCAGAPVIWSSRKQREIAQSSTEAEFIAANEACRELRWLTTFLHELKVEYQKPLLHVDNRSAAHLITTTETKRRSKHIDVKFFYIRQKTQHRFIRPYQHFNNRPVS